MIGKTVISIIPILERKRKAEAERKAKDDKKKAFLEFLKSCPEFLEVSSESVEELSCFEGLADIHQRLKRLGLFDEVKTH